MNQWTEFWLPYVVGYAFSVFGGHLAARWIVRPLYGPRHGPRLPTAALGFVERVLYTSSVILEVPILIGFWLALKVAGSWKHLETGDETGGRDQINSFLTGNAVSLIYGFVGGQGILWLQAQGWGGHVSTVPVALIAGTVVLYLWAKWRSAS